MTKARHSKKSQWTRINQGSDGGQDSVDPAFCDGGLLLWRVVTVAAAWGG